MPTSTPMPSIRRIVISTSDRVDFGASDEKKERTIQSARRTSSRRGEQSGFATCTKGTSPPTARLQSTRTTASFAPHEAVVYALKVGVRDDFETEPSIERDILIDI